MIKGCVRLLADASRGPARRAVATPDDAQRLAHVCQAKLTGGIGPVGQRSAFSGINFETPNLASAINNQMK
jgi:hypothetical protein